LYTNVQAAHADDVAACPLYEQWRQANEVLCGKGDFSA
jgi:hypothetical protein